MHKKGHHLIINCDFYNNHLKNCTKNNFELVRKIEYA